MERDAGSAPDGDVPQSAGQVGLSDPDSDGDRLQHLRAALPCEVRVTAPSHPLFGQLLAARDFRRVEGVVFLVVQLPDNSPQGPPCRATRHRSRAYTESRPRDPTMALTCNDADDQARMCPSSSEVLSVPCPPSARQRSRVRRERREED